MKKLKYYYRCIKWLYKNRDWANTRQKFKAMAKDVYLSDIMNANAELIKTMCLDDFSKFLFRFKIHEIDRFLQGKQVMDAVEQKEWLQSQDHSLLIKLMKDE